ncbi:MAG: hypothetical protein ACLUIL_01705 [Gallintestinimicrobium sp.]
MRTIVSRFAMPGGWAHNGVGVFINKTLSFAIGGNPLPLGGGRSLVNL